MIYLSTSILIEFDKCFDFSKSKSKGNPSNSDVFLCYKNHQSLSNEDIIIFHAGTDVVIRAHDLLLLLQNQATV